MAINLKKETQKNLMIVFGLNIFDKVIIFLGLIVLARLLKPEDFGILAVSEILISFIGVWNEHVFETSTIALSAKENFDTTLDTAFISRTILAIFLYIILYISSNFWGFLYNSSVIPMAIKILGINILISNLLFIPNTILVKERRFDKLIIPTILRNSSLYGTAIMLAVKGFGFWSLILSRVISNIVLAIAFFIIRPWRIRFSWNGKIFFTMLDYIKTMYFFMFAVLFITQVDKFIISKTLGVALVGYYTMAYNLGNWVTPNISAVADRVAFPLYSELKSDSSLLKIVYLKFFKYILFLSIPLLTGILLFTEYFVSIFLGAKWSIIVMPLRILSLAGFFGLIGNVSNSVLKAISRVDIDVKRNLILSITLLITLIPLTIRYGLVGSCLAVLVSFAIVQPIFFYTVMRTIKIDIGKIAKSFILILCSSLCGIIFYIFCEKLFLNNIKWLFGKFCLLFLSYISGYLITIFLLMRKEFISDIKTIFND